ncbi:MAG: sulfite exporter TauE/SafE family protein [Candidatus Margulisiibacteriota bacterium]
MFLKKSINKGLIALAFSVACFSTAIGVGGGTIIVSSLISIFKFDFKEAASTSLAMIIPITFVGAVSYFVFFKQTPPVDIYLVFIPMCLMGTMISSLLFARYEFSWLNLAFACFLIIAGLSMLKIVNLPGMVYGNYFEFFDGHKLTFLMIFGVAVGIIGKLLGVGCGLVIVPFFVIVMKMDMHEAIRLSLTTMFFLTSTATIINARIKSIDLDTLKTIMIPALLGALLGAQISSRVPAGQLKFLFGIILLGIACKFIFEELNEYFVNLRSTSQCPEN